jgi:histidinol-phosphatase (PHP family)
MLIDYHIHTTMSEDAKGELIEYVHKARKRGLSEIGCSDHFHVEKQSYLMSFEKLAQYAKKVISCKEEANFPIKLGLEVDYIPSLENQIKRILKDGCFDYIIGSVHFINGWGFDDPRYISEYQNWDITDLNRTYFSLVRQCADSHLFDIIGHLDLIKKFGFRPKEDMTEVFTKTAETIRQSNMCVEVNTAGLRMPCKEVYPSESLLKACFAHGIPITLGSDAHMPENVGKDFDKALRLVRQLGFTDIARFSQRKRKLVRL